MMSIERRRFKYGRAWDGAESEMYCGWTVGGVDFEEDSSDTRGGD